MKRYIGQAAQVLREKFVWHLYRHLYRMTDILRKDSLGALKSDKGIGNIHSGERQKRAAGSYLNIRLAAVSGAFMLQRYLPQGL